MSLTVGTGPFGHQPAGRFNFDLPSDRGLLYVEEHPKRIRAVRGGETVVDSRRARLAWEQGRLPRFWFPQEDVRMEEVERHDSELLADHVHVPWSAVDEWFEEDEPAIVHPRDPYHRIDVLETSRHVKVSVQGEVVAETRRALGLFETSLPPRWYVPQDDVRMELFEESDLRTGCAYKGFASYWSVNAAGQFEKNLVWTYREPRYEVARIKDHLAFFNERVDIELDGELQERPVTPWSKPMDRAPSPP
jgi:uncharacterized protein (DUF427 family)